MFFEKKSTSNGTQITLTGKISSSSNFNALSTEIAKENQVWINFSEVKLFDSAGIRNWIGFLSQHESKMFYYENCPSWMVKQFSTVQGLVGKNAQVVSFFAPFITIDTNDEVELFFEVKDLNSKRLPASKSPDGQKVEFNGVEEKSLHFMDLQKK